MSTTATRKPRTRKAKAEPLPNPAEVKSAAETQAEPVPPTPPAAYAGKTASAASTAYAILGCAVIATLPPLWKMANPEGPAPYWQIEIKDSQGKRYSDVYRVKDLEKAHTLAEKIARDRGIPLKVVDLPERAPAPKPASSPETPYESQGFEELQMAQFEDEQMKNGSREDNSPDPDVTPF
jgi:hypothetical protein